MKNILIYAYTQVNLGDDLFVKVLCDRYPQHQFYIICGKDESKAFLQIPNLTIIYTIRYVDRILNILKIKRPKINRVIQNCDMFINIGGSIFIEPSSWKKHVSQNKKRIIQKKPYYILGSNFGPYSTDIFYKEYKNLFKKVTDICFRDRYSYDLFSDLDNVRFAPDVVFTLSNDSIPKLNKLYSKTIIFSVIDLENRKDLSSFTLEYEEKLIETSKLLFMQGYNVIFFGFCKKEGDLNAIDRIISKIPNTYKNMYSKYSYDGDLENALQIIKSSKGIVATRFHAMILGWVFGINVYPIMYSKKTENVILDSNFNNDYSWIHNIKDVKLESIVNQLTEGNAHYVNDEIEDSQSQFQELDKVLHDLISS